MSGHLNTSSQGRPVYTGVDLHSSAYNLPIPLFWGKRRLAPNVIWWSTLLAGNGNISLQELPIGRWTGSLYIGAENPITGQKVIQGHEYPRLRTADEPSPRIYAGFGVVTWRRLVQ